MVTVASGPVAHVADRLRNDADDLDRPASDAVAVAGTVIGTGVLGTGEGTADHGEGEREGENDGTQGNLLLEGDAQPYTQMISGIGLRTVY